MLKRLMVTAAAIVVLVSFVSGCDNNAEQQRSVIMVVSTNCNAPAYSDVMSDGGSFSDTWIPVVFENRPYNPYVVTEPGLPHGEFIITSYEITWAAEDGGAVLPPRVEHTSFAIPSGGAAGAYVRLVGLEEKTGSVLIPVQTGAIRVMRATITFTGHESGTERDVEVVTSVTVEFANFVDDDVENCDLTI